MKQSTVNSQQSTVDSQQSIVHGPQSTVGRGPWTMDRGQIFKVRLIFPLLLLLNINSFAQDAHFSQYYASGLYLVVP